MQATIEISTALLQDILMLQRVERGQEWNYTRLECIVDPLRYKVADRVATLVIASVNESLGIRPVLHTYDKK
jgi:hypothetical protein